MPGAAGGWTVRASGLAWRKLLEFLFKRRQVVFHDLPDPADIDAEIEMGDDIPHSGDVLPGDL